MSARIRNSRAFFKLCLLGASSSSLLVYSLHSNSQCDVGQQTTPTPRNRVISTLVQEKKLYYEKHQMLPPPKIVHDSLERLLGEQQLAQGDTDYSDKILVIGDVHGCLDELKSLVKTAERKYNSNKKFRSVILVGDLVNKGPFSREVVHHVKSQHTWFSVRGNHDNAALEAALGDEKRISRPKYQWVQDLEDAEILWMSELPYSIRIVPKKVFSPGTFRKEDDLIVVHAGFVPGRELATQDFKSMTTMRDVVSTDDGETFSYLDKKDKSSGERTAMAWASIWNGPETVIFGHDAKRGFQNETFAIGLDTGAVYGKQLTGIVLPDHSIVSVESEKIHCPKANV